MHIHLLLLLAFIISIQISSAKAAFHFDVNQSQILLLKIEHGGREHKLNIIEGISKSTLPLPENHLLGHYLILGPYKVNTNISIGYEERVISKINSNLLITRINASPSSIASFKETLQTINTKIASSITPTFMKQTLEKIAQLDLSIELEQHLKLKLTYELLKQNRWSDLTSLMRVLNKSTAHTVAAQCHIMTKYIQIDAQVRDAFSLEFSAKLARDIYVFQRDIGKLSNSASSILSIERYEKICRPLLQVISEKISKTLLSTDNPQWGVEQDANILFEYILALIPSQEALLAARLFNHTWLYFYFNDKHDLGVQTSKKAIDLVNIKSSNQVQLAISLHNNLFSSLVRLGKFGEAQFYATESLKLAEGLSKHSVSSMQLNMGFLYYYVGEYEVSKRYFESSITTMLGDDRKWNVQECEVEGKFKHAVAYRIGLLGTVYSRLEHYKAAEKHLNCGVKILSEIDSLYEMVLVNEMAKSAYAQKSYIQAIQLANQILDDSRVITAQRLDAQIILLGSSIKLSHTNITEKQIQNLAEAFGYSRFYNSDLLNIENNLYPLRQIDLFRQLVIFHSKRDELKWVELFAQKALSIINKQLNSVSNPLAWTAAQFLFVQSYVDTFPLKNNLTSENYSKLFDLLEKHYSLQPRAEYRLFSIESVGMNSDEHRASNLMDWFAAESDIINKNNADSTYAKQQVDKTRGIALSHVGKNSRLQTFLNENLSLETIQELMPKGDLFLRFFSTENSMYMLSVDKNSIGIKEIDERIDIEKYVADSINSNSSNNKAKYVNARNLLPIDEFLRRGVKRLVIVPDKELHNLPFAMLNISDLEDRYTPLITNLQTIMTTSASNYYASQSVKNKGALSAAIFGSPIVNDTYNQSRVGKRGLRQVSSKQFPYLSGTLTEAEKIEETLEGFELHIAINENATNEFLMSDKARNANILHIATHGYFDPSAPELVGLITTSTEIATEHGFLSLSQLLSRPVSNNLVVISGCDTLRGKYYKGSGMRSMTRGFLTQGAGSVIGTLWPVQDRATAKFMEIFYNNLRKSENTSVALQLTQKQFSQSGRYRHPRYWAGFVLTVANKQNETISLN